MRAELTKDSLWDALQHVIKAVPVNSPVPVLAGIHIQARAEGIILTASSISMTIESMIPHDGHSVNVQRTGAVVVPSRYFCEVIRKLDAGAIILEMKEPFILTVIAAHSQIRLCGMDPAEFPYIPTLKDHSAATLRINNALLGSAIRQVAVAASTSETRPALTGVSFGCDHASLNLAATDGIRLASRTIHIESSISNCSAVIPARNLVEVSRMLGNAEGTTEVEVSNDRVKFITNGLTIESALIGSVFPSIKNLIPQSYLCEIVVDTACLLKAVECVAVLAGERLIKLVAGMDKLQLLSRTAEIGDIEYDIPLIERRGEAFIISLNGKYFLDILRSCESGKVQIRYTGNKGPIVVLPNDSHPSALFLLTPVRTSI